MGNGLPYSAREVLFENNNDLDKFLEAYVSTMQLWVEQADEEGKNVFYSPEPVHIGFLPLSDDYWSDTPFKPWEFGSADADKVTIDECNYLPNINQCNVDVSVLGVRSWPEWVKQTELRADPTFDWMRLIKSEADPTNPRCGGFSVPTAALANDPLVFVMSFPPHPPDPDGPSALKPCITGSGPSEGIHGIRTTFTIPRSRIGPSFKQSEIQIRRTKELPPSSKEPPAAKELPASNAGNKHTKAGDNETGTKVWQILIPVANSACGDKIELPDDILRSRALAAAKTSGKNTKSDVAASPDFAKIDVQWRNGNDKLTACTPRPDDPTSDAYKRWAVTNKKADDAWKAADKSGRIRLYLEIPWTAINDLPNRVDVVRTTTDGVTWVVATLPNLRRLLLPTRLSLEPLGPTQFALRGDNAGVIDAVAMQNDNSSKTFVTAPGVDFALITLPGPSDKTGSDTPVGNTGAGNNSSTQITIDTTKDSTDHVKMTTQSSSTSAKGAAPSAKPSAALSPDDQTSASKSALAAGSYAVVPLIRVGDAPVDRAELDADVRTTQLAVTKAQANLKAATAALKNNPSDQTTKTAEAQARTSLANANAASAQASKAAKEAKPTPLYMPVTVTDEKGKPLIFSIAEPKKTAAAMQASSTPTSTTCATSCVVAPCAVACPVPSQTTAPKSQ
jgi:hypothetical protein